MHFIYKMLIGAIKGVDALLGVDWLQAAGAKIDFAVMQMLIGRRQIVHLRSMPMKEYASTPVRIKSNVVVRPRACVLVTCYAEVDGTEVTFENALFEPEIQLIAGLEVTAGVVHPTNESEFWVSEPQKNIRYRQVNC